MSPEAARALTAARQQLADARSILRLPIARVAAREAYLAAYHAIEAYIFAHTGRAARTHAGLRTMFARLARDEPRIDQSYLRFLARAYDLKAVADYSTDPGKQISFEEAESTIDTAEQLVELLAALLAAGR